MLLDLSWTLITLARKGHNVIIFANSQLSKSVKVFNRGNLTYKFFAKRKTRKLCSIVADFFPSPYIITYLFLLFWFLTSEGPHCQDEMDHNCEIETYYYPEKSSTSVDQHIPVSVLLDVLWVTVPYRWKTPSDI